MKLRRPLQTDKVAILEMMAEFETSNSTHDGGFWMTQQFSYFDWLQNNQDYEMGINISSRFVPAIQLVSFADDGRALGFLHLRLRLNDTLLEKGGHIGYSIRPSERGKGYAKEQLRLGLEFAKEKNIHSVLVTCDESNLASKKVIMANGGHYEDTRNGTERYWIDLEKDNE